MPQASPKIYMIFRMAIRKYRNAYESNVNETNRLLYSIGAEVYLGIEFLFWSFTS